MKRDEVIAAQHTCASCISAVPGLAAAPVGCVIRVVLVADLQKSDPEHQDRGSATKSACIVTFAVQVMGGASSISTAASSLLRLSLQAVGSDKDLCSDPEPFRPSVYRAVYHAVMWEGPVARALKAHSLSRDTNCNQISDVCWPSSCVMQLPQVCYSSSCQISRLKSGGLASEPCMLQSAFYSSLSLHAASRHLMLAKEPHGAHHKKAVQRISLYPSTVQ